MVKSIPYALSKFPGGPKVGPFHSATSPFWDTRLSRSEMHGMISQRPYTVKCQKCPLYTKYLPRGLQKKKKIGNAQKWPQADLERLTVTVPYMHEVLTPGAQIVASITLRPAVFEMHGENWKFNEWVKIEHFTVKSTLYACALST